MKNLEVLEYFRIHMCEENFRKAYFLNTSKKGSNYHIY